MTSAPAPDTLATMALRQSSHPSPELGPARPGPVLYCGDPHGTFAHILEAAADLRASAVILLGDLDAAAPLHELLAPIADLIYWVPGNHDTDSAENFANTFDSQLASKNIHGRVVRLPDGTNLAGLGGVFRESVWYPNLGGEAGEPKFRSREQHAKSTPRQDRWRGGPHLRHWSSIYPDVVDHLATQRADVLVTHEAPTYHPNGFPILDTLAQSLGVKVSVHGHHHDRIDSSDRWSTQGFKSFSVGLRGITSISLDGLAQVIVPGELDAQRHFRQRYLDVFIGEQ